MMSEEKNISCCTKLKVFASILAGIAVLLIIASFFVPPHGVVDGSVLAAVGELFAFAALFMGWEAMERGVDAKITHGNTTIDLKNDEQA